MKEISRKVFFKSSVGVLLGTVIDNEDPEKLGRVKVTFPDIPDYKETDWIRVAVLMTGSKRGYYFVPEIDDEVLVAFEHANIKKPIVIGSLWSRKDKPHQIHPKNNKEHGDVLKYLAKLFQTTTQS